MKNKHQIAVDELLLLARDLSDDDASWAITYLMSAAIYLQVQIGMPKNDFLFGANLQWDEIAEFMDAL